MLINHKQICLFRVFHASACLWLWQAGIWQTRMRRSENFRMRVGQPTCAGCITSVRGLYNLRARVGEQTVKRCRTDHRRRGFL
jgi:hypothetical protein